MSVLIASADASAYADASACCHCCRGHGRRRTIEDGVAVHDLVRDFTIAQANRRPGGLPALQQRVVMGLMAARPPEGG